MYLLYLLHIKRGHSTADHNISQIPGLLVDQSSDIYKLHKPPAFCISGLYLSVQTTNVLSVDTSRGETIQINVRGVADF